MKSTSTSYEAGLKEDLANPQEAAAYLNAALEDGSQDGFLMALRDVADAKGITEVTEESTVNRENVYRILTENGNPRLSSLSGMLETMGLKLAVEVRHATA